MEKSLDALERMAGELGATVVVAREIVVPKGVLESGDTKMTDTPKSGSSGSTDDLEPFSLELESPGSTPPSSNGHSQLGLKPNKNNRRIKLAQKAEHKRIRREVKRSVNAAYAVTASPLLTCAVPPALGVPEVVVAAPEVAVAQVAVPAPEIVVDASVDVVIPVDSAPSPTVPDPDEVIIIEALVVRKLALEEAFLDFGGFSVLG